MSVSSNLNTFTVDRMNAILLNANLLSEDLSQLRKPEGLSRIAPGASFTTVLYKTLK